MERLVNLITNLQNEKWDLCENCEGSSRPSVCVRFVILCHIEQHGPLMPQLQRNLFEKCNNITSLTDQPPTWISFVGTCSCTCQRTDLYKSVHLRPFYGEENNTNYIPNKRLGFFGERLCGVE